MTADLSLPLQISKREKIRQRRIAGPESFHVEDQATASTGFVRVRLRRRSFYLLICWPKQNGTVSVSDSYHRCDQEQKLHVEISDDPDSDTERFFPNTGSIRTLASTPSLLLLVEDFLCRQSRDGLS